MSMNLSALGKIKKSRGWPGQLVDLFVWNVWLWTTTWDGFKRSWVVGCFSSFKSCWQVQGWRFFLKTSHPTNNHRHRTDPKKVLIHRQIKHWNPVWTLDSDLKNVPVPLNLTKLAFSRLQVPISYQKNICKSTNNLLGRYRCQRTTFRGAGMSQIPQQTCLKSANLSREKKHDFCKKFFSSFL